MLRPDPFIKLIAFMFLLFAFTASVHAQNSALMEAQRVRQQRLNLEVQKVMDLKQSMSQRLLWDWGGSERFMFLTYDDIDNARVSDKRRTQRTNNFYLWGSLNLEDIHSFYVRFHGQHIDWNSGDKYRSTENQFKWNPEEGFDQGTYSLSFDKALKKYLNYDMPFQMKVVAGRFRSSLGSQLAYTKRANGVQLEGSSKLIDFKLFAFKNLIDEENIDFSTPGFRSSRRFFYGAEMRYKGFKRHLPYLFALIQEDDSGENIEDVDQDYGYDSKYYGIGSRGKFTENLFYTIEGIMQSGRSFPQAAAARGYSPGNERIEAWAFDSTLTYQVNKITHPMFITEYAFGSGDPHRIGRVTNTTGGGNKEGTTDRNFLTFGYIDTGLTLAARISNLRMVKLGFSFTPTELVKNSKNHKVTVGVNYFIFNKDEKLAAISDSRADNPVRNLGKEFDVNITWQILSDLSASINYGRFYPGNAYSDKDARDFVMATIMFQF